jgi:hypothetical protein
MCYDVLATLTLSETVSPTPPIRIQHTKHFMAVPSRMHGHSSVQTLSWRWLSVHHGLGLAEVGGPGVG